MSPINHDGNYSLSHTEPARLTTSVAPTSVDDNKSLPKFWYDDLSKMQSSSAFCHSLFSSLATPDLENLQYISYDASYIMGSGSLASSTITTIVGVRTSTTLAVPSTMKAPDGCCMPCSITAEHVRLLFWPLKSDRDSASITSAPSIPSGYSSDGMTL